MALQLTISSIAEYVYYVFTVYISDPSVRKVSQRLSTAFIEKSISPYQIGFSAINQENTSKTEGEYRIHIDETY